MHPLGVLPLPGRILSYVVRRFLEFPIAAPCWRNASAGPNRLIGPILSSNLSCAAPMPNLTASSTFAPPIFLAVIWTRRRRAWHIPERLRIRLWPSEGLLPPAHRHLTLRWTPSSLRDDLQNVWAVPGLTVCCYLCCYGACLHLCYRWPYVDVCCPFCAC